MASFALSPYRVAGTAFITGGASGILFSSPHPGIGKAVATTFARNGIENIALLDINESALQPTKADLGAEFPDINIIALFADVASEEDVAKAVESVVEQFGRIDVAVHAAGIAHLPGRTHELRMADWQKVISVNQTGIFICVKAVITQMLRQEYASGFKGVIVNVASVMGVRIPDIRVGAAAYVASKHAIIGLTRLDAKLYGRDGIRINAISLAAGHLDFEIDRTAIGRSARAEEVANAVLFLSSPMSSYVYGSTLMVDGGYSL
ncbi:SDR family NAD(P)-dependent oxidoreductase [Aspergillus stella-maris]|uniref:SDR family NAD(P)-dependent oxidoreductase n=1 Tax=Aspergillus stella-maris TaxID=1810926 RepID=UPI003CCDEA65